MMIVAGCAVLFNLILGVVLHGICKIPHSHGHSHHGHSHDRKKHSHRHTKTHNHLLSSGSESDDDLEHCVNEERHEKVGKYNSI